MTEPGNFPLEPHEPSTSSPSPSNWWKSIPEITSPDKPLKSSSSSIKVLREMERLCLISEHGADDLKHKLMIYKSGDFWIPIGGIKKEDLEIPPVITVLLVGLSGSGKSSLINLMYSVLGRSGFIPFSQTSGDSSTYSTMILEEHNVLRSTRNGFCVYDSRGLDCNRMEDCLAEVTRWMKDGVRHNQLCRFGGDGVDGSLKCCSSGFVRRRVNYAVVVVDLTDVYKAFFCGGDLKQVEAIKLLFHSPSLRTSNVDPILILTHGDMLQPMERLLSRIKICSYLGIPVTKGAYDIACPTDQCILSEESDPVTFFALTEAVYRILLQSDRTHLPKKTIKDWIIDFLSRVVSLLAYFFAVISRILQKWSDQHRMPDLMTTLPKKTC